MKEKILALLTAKFAGVRKDGLARLASALALNATTDEEAGALVEKLTAEAVNDFVTDYRKDVDTEVSTATRTHEGNLKKKYDFTEKVTDPGKKPKTKGDEDDDDQIPAWAKALVESNQSLTEKLSKMEGQKASEARLQQIEAKFTGVPESYKTQRLADARLIVGGMDDAAFEEYSSRLDTDIAAFNQELADSKLEGTSKPIFGSKDSNGVSSAVSAYLAGKSEQGKPLEGKPV